MYAGRIKRAILLPMVLLGLAESSGAQHDGLAGVWLPLAADVIQNPELTEAGREAVASYDPLRDDPDLRCMPASLTNVLGIPDPPFEVILHDRYVEMNFEYMDVRRRVPIDPSLSAENAPYTVEKFPHLGRSVGSYENGVLVIETAGMAAGPLDTRGAVEGYPRSTAMKTIERFTVDNDSLHVEISHEDPVYYHAPLVMTFDFHRVDLEILEFGCTLEAAGYQDRL